MQQDAEECCAELFSQMEPYMNFKDKDGVEKNLIDDLFRIDMEVKITCEENAEEPPIVKIETDRKLRCTIDNEINTIQEGI